MAVRRPVVGPADLRYELHVLETILVPRDPSADFLTRRIQRREARACRSDRWTDSPPGNARSSSKLKVNRLMIK
jgi:hypothetical protein